MWASREYHTATVLKTAALHLKLLPSGLDDLAVMLNRSARVGSKSGH